ncbi:MAG: type 1 glutamine amidotransferase family protein [Micromonosporaceae bacterium]
MTNESAPERETVHVAAYDTLADWEVGFATAHLNNPQFQRVPGRFRVVMVGETDKPVTSTGGMRILPDLTLDELTPSESAMLILPGGSAWMAVGGNAAFGKKAREFVEAGVPVAGICGATVGLAREGLLDDRVHTGNSPDELAVSGYQGAAHYRDEPAVTAGDVITAGGVAPVEFAREIFAKLDVYAPEVLAAWFLMFRHHDPSGFAAMMGDGS